MYIRLVMNGCVKFVSSENTRELTSLKESGYEATYDKLGKVRIYDESEISDCSGVKAHTVSVEDIFGFENTPRYNKDEDADEDGDE